MGSQRLRPRQDSSAVVPEDPVQTSPTNLDPLPPSDTSLPPSDTSPPPNTGPTSPPGGGASDTGGSQTNPTPTTNSNTGQSPTNGGGGQNSGSLPPTPTGAGSGPTNDAEGSLVTTNGQTLSIAGGVTVAVSQFITEHNGQITTVTVPIATLSPTTTGLTTSQRDGIIAGSVVGGFLIGMVVIGFLFYRRRHRIRQQEKVESGVARPRRLLHSDGPLDLAAGSTNPYMTTAWTSQPQMAQYETVDSGSPFTMGDPISSPRMSRARTSVSGSIFQEDVWPPPGEEYLGTLGSGGSPAGGGPMPPSRTSLDLSESASPARPFAAYDPANASIQPHPILTSFSSPHGLRPSTPTSLVSSPISYASGSRLIPSAAAAAKARESTSESTRARYNRSSWFGPTSGPHSAYSESEYGSGGGAGGGAGGGGGGSSTMSQVDQAESSPAPPLIDLNNTASRAGTGSSGTTSDRGGFNEAINARLNPMGLGGGPSPGPTPLDNEIPPLYSMIRRDTDLSLEGGTTPGRST